MKIIQWEWLLLIAIGLSLVAEEVPESIRMSQWDFAVHGEVRYHVADPRDPSKRVPFPEAIWHDVGRRVARPMADHASAWRMIKEGTWRSFVRQSVTSVEDVIIGEYAVNPGYETCSELEPVPTKEQEAWCKGLVERWMVPVPDGFDRVGPGGSAISTWNRWRWRNQSKIFVTQRSVPRRGSGGPDETVYWYDRPMTDEDMMIEIAGGNDRLELRREFGHTLAFPLGEDPRKRIEVVWPSGQFLIYLNLPKEHYRKMLSPYLDKYPPSWDSKIEYDPQRLMLKVLNDAIPEMSKHIDGPLEYLRYSFRTYPFDDACQRVWRILPSNELDRLHKEAILAIHNDWAKIPADQIKLSDYHDAMLAYRRELLAKIIAERDRIAKDGVERKVP